MLTRRAFLKLTGAGLALHGLRLDALAAPVCPPCQPFGFPLTFPVCFIDADVKYRQVKQWLPIIRSE